MSGILKELAEYLAERPAPSIIEHQKRKYSDKQLFELKNPRPYELETTTLTAIVDYVRQKVDVDTFSGPRYIINILSPIKVVLTSEAAEDAGRWDRIVAEAITPDIHFGRFLDPEMFTIELQSKFVETEIRKMVLAIVGNITDGTITEHQDDGLTQSVNIKAGIQRVGKEKVPNPVILAPYRTFPEIDQPESPFVLRLKSGRGEELPTAAVFEADGSAWRLEAIAGIKKFFADAFDGRDDIVILA